MIRIGLVGVGGFAAVWRRVCARLEDEGLARIVAVAEIDHAGQAETLAHLAMHGCHVTGSLSEMLAECGNTIDLVGLPIGIPWHFKLAREALLSGHHVLVEKPLSATAAQALELQTLAAERDLQLQVGFQFMYSPTIRALARRIRSGKLGRVLSIASVTGWPRAANYYARNRWAGRLTLGDLPVLDGPATNATAHYLMNMLYLGGCTPGDQALARIVSVQAELYRVKDITSYDTSSLRVTLTNGATLCHNVSHALAETIPPVLDIQLERATVHWQASSDTATITYPTSRTETIANPAPDRIHELPLRHMVATVGGSSSLPGETFRCTAKMASRHVEAINLAFVSSGEIHSITQSARRTELHNGGDSLVIARGMADLLRAAHAHNALLSEIGAPWGVSTQPARTQSLEAFSIDALTRAS